MILVKKFEISLNLIFFKKKYVDIVFNNVLNRKKRLSRLVGQSPFFKRGKPMISVKNLNFFIICLIMF